MTLLWDMGGNDLVTNSVSVGATAPGQAGTTLSGSELTVLDGVTPGTAAASKALVLNSSSAITTGLTALTVTTVTPTTIAGTPNFSGAPTFASTSAFTGAITPTGGVAAAGGFTFSPRNCHTGNTAAQVSTDFTDATPSTTETYYSEVFVPANASLTGVALMNGSNVTGSVTVYLTNSAGTNLAHSASTAGSGTAAYQRIPFTAPYAAVGPATYYVATQYNSATARYRAHTIGNFGTGKDTGSTYGTFPTPTIPTTFTTALGNVASLY